MAQQGVEKWEIISHQLNLSSNQLFSNLFSKTYFHEIFAKNAWERIPVISTLWHNAQCKNEKSTLTEIFFVKSTI